MFIQGGILIVLSFCVGGGTTGNAYIGDEGVAWIAKGLKKNTSLTHIILERVFLHVYCTFIVAYVTILSP